MAIEKVSNAPVVLESNDERIEYGTMSYTNEAGGSSNTLAPDYYLNYTGEEVANAIGKALDINPDDMGGLKVLKSTVDEPANIDTLLQGNCYIAAFMTSSNFPAEFSNMSPIRVDVTVKPGVVIQVIRAQGNKYYRWSKDAGNTWSAFSPKSINSGTIDTSGEPSPVPKKDPIQIIKDRIDSVEAISAKSTSLGTDSIAAAILNGNYDFDTNQIV